MDCAFRPPPDATERSGAQYHGHFMDISAKLSRLQAAMEQSCASNRSVEAMLMNMERRYQAQQETPPSPSLKEIDHLWQTRIDESHTHLLQAWSNSQDNKLLRHAILNQHAETLKNVENAVSDHVRKQETQSKYTDKAKHQEPPPPVDTDPWKGNMSKLQQELSAGIVAQVLDQLPERLEHIISKEKPVAKEEPLRRLSSVTPPHVTRPHSGLISSCDGNVAKFQSREDTSNSLGVFGPISEDDLPKKDNSKTFSAVGTPGKSSKAFVSDNFASDGETDDVELTFEARPSGKRGLKLTMAVDQNDDEPELVLEEDASLTGIFSNDTDVSKPIHRVEDYYSSFGTAQKTARSHTFENLTIFVVLLNAIYLAIDSDYNAATNIYDAEWPFLIATQFFCIYFTGEIFIRFLAFQVKYDSFKDGWFRFDLFLVATMILDVWVIMLALKLMAGAGKIRIPTQPLRMLRLFKLTRMARLMKAFPELMVMIKGLVQSLRATASSMVLLGVLIYTEAILLHLLLRDEKEYNLHLKANIGYEFGSIGHCMWTLLMAGTLMLDNASILMTELLFNDRFVFVLCGILFIIFTFISALLILQMLIGVLCDVVSRVNEERRDAACVGLVKQELMGYLKTIDNGDGRISKKELAHMFEQQKSLALLRKLNINKVFFLQLCQLTFHDGDSPAVPVRTILELLIMCRGGNPVNVNIIASTLCLLINHIEDVNERVEYTTQIVNKKHRKSIGGQSANANARPSYVNSEDFMDKVTHDSLKNPTLGW